MTDKETEAKIERTPDAMRHQLKTWTCQVCGSRHSRMCDAEAHWHMKHGDEILQIDKALRPA